MEENIKIKIVANDLVRRLGNSLEELGEEEYTRVVDQYAQKLLNSGYSMEQTRNIIVSGIQSPDFYANLRTRFVGRFGGKSRKICTKIYYLRQLLLSFLENYHKLSKTILDNHHRLS